MMLILVDIGVVINMDDNMDGREAIVLVPWLAEDMAPQSCPIQI